jgi:hypothetical protein
MVINGELECRYPPPPNTVTPSPNGPAAAGGQTPPLHVPPAATIPLPTQAALGITPVQQKMDTLRDKLGLVPPQEARGPGAAPIPGGGQGSRNPGPNDQPPSELNCVGSALTGVKHPGDIAGLDRWERSHFGQGARSALDLLRMPGDRDVQHRATDIERNGDRPRTRIVETRWTDSAGVRHTFRETQQQARAWSRDGGKWVSTGSYESTSSGGPGGHGQTVYFDGSGQEQYRVQYGADGSRSGVSIDGGRTWGPYQDENEDGRPDNAPAESEPVDTGLPPPGRSASPSQPVDGAPDQRDYWCETGVTNPGERPKPAAAGGAIRDPGRGSLSGVIVQPNPPRTPEQLREMTCQPGPDGDACRTGGGGGPQQNPISRFAQPRVPSGPGAGGTPHVPGLERPGSGAVTPGIPKPGDPERGS